LASKRQLKHLSETRSAKAFSKCINKIFVDFHQIVQMQTLDKKGRFILKRY
jgi:hypothetical protein